MVSRGYGCAVISGRYRTDVQLTMQTGRQEAWQRANDMNVRRKQCDGCARRNPQQREMQASVHGRALML